MPLKQSFLGGGGTGGAGFDLASACFGAGLGGGGGGLGAGTLSILDLTERLLVNDRHFRQQTIATSEEWKRGDKFCTLPTPRVVLLCR